MTSRLSDADVTSFFIVSVTVIGTVTRDTISTGGEKRSIFAGVPAGARCLRRLGSARPPGPRRSAPRPSSPGERRGARFEVDGDCLRAAPKEALDAELYAAIGAAKARGHRSPAPALLYRPGRGFVCSMLRMTDRRMRPLRGPRRRQLCRRPTRRKAFAIAPGAHHDHARRRDERGHSVSLPRNKPSVENRRDGRSIRARGRRAAKCDVCRNPMGPPKRCHRPPTRDATRTKKR